MRNSYLLCYDICDPKRLRAVHKTVRDFGTAMQYSVFRCDLTEGEKFILLGKLTPIIKHDEDSVMLVNLGPRNDQSRARFEFLGKAKGTDDDQPCIVI